MFSRSGTSSSQRSKGCMMDREGQAADAEHKNPALASRLYIRGPGFAVLYKESISVGSY
jgi:hypothetical protein